MVCCYALKLKQARNTRVPWDYINVYYQGDESVGLSDTAELVADVVKDMTVSQSQPAVMCHVDSVKSAVDSLLPIVQSQRERFRLRAQELEAVSDRLIRLIWLIRQHTGTLYCKPYCLQRHVVAVLLISAGMQNIEQNSIILEKKREKLHISS